MKGSHLKIVLTVCIIAILVVALIYVESDKNDNRWIPVNDGLTSLVEFDMDCPEIGTSTEGTFFVMQSKDSVNIKVAADLIVGETDKRGIEFFVPAELDIVSVLCSFKGDISDEYVLIKERLEGGHYVQIAREYRYSDGMPIGTDGGQGMLIMDLRLSGLAKLNDIDSLDFSIIMGSEYEDIVIPISH